MTFKHPGPLLAHNYKVVKVIKERKLANRGKEKDFQAVGACGQGSRNQKSKIGGQTATHAGAIQASDHLHQRKWGEGGKEALLQGLLECGRQAEMEHRTLEDNPESSGSCKESASPLGAASKAAHSL